MNNNKKENLLKPLNDYAFKRMFGDKGREEQLKTLLNGLIILNNEVPVKNIEILEKEIARNDYNNKEVRLDVLAKTDDGRIFNIEAQYSNVDIRKRNIFYIAKTLTKFLDKGQDYTQMKDISLIAIFENENKKRDKYEGYYNHEKFNESEEVYTYNLARFDKIKNKDINNSQHRCLMFLSDKTDEKMRKKVIEMEPGLAKAQEILDFINSSPEEKRLYYDRELVKMDIAVAKKRNTQEGIEIGKEEGIEIGKEEKTIEIAIKLKNKGVSIEDIVEITGIDPKLIEKL